MVKVISKLNKNILNSRQIFVNNFLNTLFFNYRKLILLIKKLLKIYFKNIQKIEYFEIYFKKFKINDVIYGIPKQKMT